MSGAIPPLSNTPSWCGAQFSTGTALPYVTLRYLTLPYLYQTKDFGSWNKMDSRSVHGKENFSAFRLY
jgi:hypothetical protein